MKKLHIVSLGCTKNLVDTEVMLGRLGAMELTDAPDDADVIIVNTCGFIDAAKEESINTVLDLHDARKEESVLVMAGCLSERYKAELQEELKEVDLFTGVGDYGRIDELLAQKSSRFSGEVFLLDGEERVVTGSSYHAYVKLAEGCNQQCSFCAIPSFKGKLHSRTLESVKKELVRLTGKGYFDLSFIAQDSSSYLRDVGEKEGLIRLIETVHQVEAVQSARILYLYPTTTSKALVKAIADSPVFHNYFDIPVQHTTDAMLKRMKRGMGETAMKELINTMRKVPDSWLRTSVIVGHPGESDADFEAMYAYIQSGVFDMVNVFAYSDEEGTASFDMEDKVPEAVIEERVARLSTLIQTMLEQRLGKMVGETIPVIYEGQSDQHEYLYSAKHLAWAPDIDPAILINDSEVETPVIGERYRAVITDTAGDQLLATLLKP